MRKSDKTARIEKTFGEAFGQLIREKRGQEELTQKDVAIGAFDDEGKVRRIIELENGSVRRPHAKTIDALVVFFNITEEELERCRKHGRFKSTDAETIGLPRELLENLALRFEHNNPDAPDDELIAHLKGKAQELKAIKQRLAEIEGAIDGLGNQIASANAALEKGLFDEADDILAAVEELQQEERTLKEITAQSKIRFARGDAALFAGRSSSAASHYVKAAGYFSGFGNDKVADTLSEAAQNIYEFQRRSPKPDFKDAIDLAARALELTDAKDTLVSWAQARDQLALLQQNEAKERGENSSILINQAIDSLIELLSLQIPELENFDWASFMILLGNCYLERGHRRDNDEWENDIDAAIRTFDDTANDSRIDSLDLHRCHMHNNISAAYIYKSRRCSDDQRQALKSKAKKALERAIELSAAEGQLDVWSAAHFNLGKLLAEAASDKDLSEKAPEIDHEAAIFLKVQSIAALNASAEGFAASGFSLQFAGAQLSLGRALLDYALLSATTTKEIYLARSIGAHEMALQVFDRDSHTESWSTAQHCIGLACFFHAQIADGEQAANDLEMAITYFDSALSGFQTLRSNEDLEELARFKNDAAGMLGKLRNENRTKQA
jgi:transcriptional regulator with XRE-family HTH domain